MARIYTTRFHVRHYEVDSAGHVHHDVYQNYLHQLAMEASADAGYDAARYEQLGTVWYIRTLIVEYGRPATFDDVLEGRSWVSDMRKFRSHREYVLTHIPSDDVAVRAQADWIYLDVRTGWPKRFSPDILVEFTPSDQTAVEPVSRADEPDAHPEAPVTTIPWTVRRREADMAGHVNNAVYTGWFEEAIWRALGDVTTPITRHEIEYLQPARPGDVLAVSVRPRSRVGDRLTWLAEVVRSTGGEVLTRDYVDTQPQIATDSHG
jgi:acyl-CoA thioester hydrolase